MIGGLVDGKYEIVTLIGEGGMGAVYEARQTTTGRAVAVKVISNEALADDEVLRTRFEREAQAAAKIRSPHIVEIFDAGRDDQTGHPYMVLELLCGETVHAALRRLGPLPPDLATRIGVQTCLGLQKAHEAGVVHRDIKPANLFLCEGDDDELIVKLLDFGVAKVMMEHASADSEVLTRTGSILGSPMYMSPEQARGLKTIDHRADIWSLAVVLYQLCHGKTPWSNVEGLGELIITICSEPPRPLHELAPWVPRRLSDAIAGGLRLAAGDRYPTAAAFAEALQACLARPAEWHIRRSMVAAMSDEDRSSLPTEQENATTLALDPEELARMGGADDAPPSNAPTVMLDAVEPPPPSNAPTMMLDAAAGPAVPAAPAKSHGRVVSGEVGSVWAGGDHDADTAREAKLQTAKAGDRRAAQRALGGAVVPVAIGVLVVMAALAYYLVEGGGGSGAASGRAAAPSSAPSRATTPAKLPAPAQSTVRGDRPSASATTSAAAGAVAMGGGRVQIMPAYARVTLDGKPATLSDGHLQVRGELDSVHRVVLTVNGKEKSVTVKITNDGVEPRQIVFMPKPGAAGDGP